MIVCIIFQIFLVWFSVWKAKPNQTKPNQTKQNQGISSFKSARNHFPSILNRLPSFLSEPGSSVIAVAHLSRYPTLRQGLGVSQSQPYFRASFFLQQHRRALSPRTGVVASRRLISSSKHRNKNRTEQIGLFVDTGRLDTKLTKSNQLSLYLIPFEINSKLILKNQNFIKRSKKIIV